MAIEAALRFHRGIIRLFLIFVVGSFFQCRRLQDFASLSSTPRNGQSPLPEARRQARLRR
jgi:hypothetical protein